MDFTGIIAEYDPFHNGHAAQLAAVRAAGAQCIAVCMSSGAVQRGGVPILPESVRVRAALDAGADDYLTKPFSVDELLARLRVTQRRLSLMKADTAQETPIFTNGALKIDYAAGCAYIDGAELHLTPIEYKLLCLLSKNVGKVLTHTYITQQIWGSSWENDIASLRVFMATLRKKLENGKDGQQYIQTHIGIGYRMLRVE